ncbi:hypothetical protein ONZ45_g4816 [Pleurotus djamor]|nr:hypothetical protein ONZ45_g4816 [Pleurotus djamor]
MGGSFFDKLSFNPGQYARKIMSMDLQEHARRIYSKRRILASTHGRAIGGVLASPATGGLSLLGTAAAGYQGDTEERKLDVLEQTWQQRGQYPLPTHFIRDTLVPVVLSTAFGVLGFFIDFGGVVDGIVHKAVYWLGDSLHLTGQSSTNAISGYYNEFTNKWMDFMGEKFGNKIVDSYNQRNTIPNGYYPHPQPG